MVRCYRRMLEDMALVTRNDCTEAINVVLDAMSAATNVSVLIEMYTITLDALKTANNDRLWFNTNLKLAKLNLDMKKIGEVERLLSELHKLCKLPDGSDDVKGKGTNLLDVYCLEMMLCTATQVSN